MRTVLVKDNHSTGNTSLADPRARPGKLSDSVTAKRIHGVPDNVTAAEVVLLWSQTSDLTWLGGEGDTLSRGRFEFEFSELGIGRILMK